jgi:hypothetical protein
LVGRCCCSTSPTHRGVTTAPDVMVAAGLYLWSDWFTVVTVVGCCTVLFIM